MINQIGVSPDPRQEAAGLLTLGLLLIALVAIVRLLVSNRRDDD